MLFTNGTGTGKTYSGLGVIKRFAKQGKGNILIVVPSQDIMKDWIKSGENLGLTINALESTTDAGEGICVTTYANFGANQHLADREWDLVVADESHKLMTNEAGEPTEALHNFRAITNHPNGLNTKAYMSLRVLVDEIAQLKSDIEVDSKSDDDRNRANAKDMQPVLDAKIVELENKRKALVEQYARQPRSKVVMLSATPFAYVKNIDYAEGYLFEYGKDDGGAYNSGDGREKFYMQHFGYRMRYNKLTQPDANVNGEVMERSFNEYLKKTGALSGRRLNIDQDYERSFALVDDAIGEKIDEGLEWLRTASDGRYSPIREAIMKKFDYLARMRLLEALKARQAVKIISQNLDMGRKIVVFHDYNEGGNLSNPFKNISFESDTANLKDGGEISTKNLLAEAMSLRPDIFNLDIEGIASPINTIKTNFPQALIYNGTVSNKDRAEAKRLFNDDESGNDIIVVQSAAGEAGISLHDTTGKHRRILLNLGMPTRPTTAIQQEGRIYRVGQKTDAIFKYMNTGTTWERQTFASKISERASTVENLALGDEARALKQAFIDAFQNSDYYEPSEDEGKGGKEADKAQTSTMSPFDKAKSFYYAQAKNTKSRANREGKDYYATPEPVGFKMVEFGGVKSGDKLLEPSAGHGAIARFFPEANPRTLVEQSSDLSSRAALASPGAKVITGGFESLHITNKYDVIVMNPPYGSAGKTAIEHVAKAATHLRNGGRIVALIPEGKANERLSELLSGDDGKDLYPVADIHLPSSTFERAGTGVMTHIVVMEKQKDKENAGKIRARNIDLTNAQNVKELFDRLEGISLPPRLEPLTQEAVELIVGEKMTFNGLTFIVESNKMVMMENRIDKQQYAYLARLCELQHGWMYSSSGKMVYSFREQDALQKFLGAVERGEKPTTPSEESPAANGSTVITEAAEFPHSKTGDMVYVAKLTVRLDNDAYRRVSQKAGEFSGYYSSFSKFGAIPGFHFKTKENRDGFMAAVNGPAPGKAGFDSLNGGVSLSEAMGLVSSLAQSNSSDKAQRLAIAIGVQIVEPDGPDFALTTQTEEERRAKEAADKAALAKQEQERIAAERKAQADRDAADFRLTGSSAPADVAASYGQNDLFAPKTIGQREAEKNLPKSEATISDADYAQVVEAARYLKDIVYSLDNLIGDDQRLLVALSSELGKSGRDTILMDAFGIDRNLAHTIHNRMDDSKPHKLRDIDMADAFDTFPMLKKVIDDAKEELRQRDERRAARMTGKNSAGAAAAAPVAALADDDLNPNSPNYRYRDTGYIADSRKEKAQDQIRASRAAGQMVGFQQIDWDAIEQNPRAAKELITKSNLFGKVDWDALKAAGMEPEAGFLIDRVYASIAPEPAKDGVLGRKDYAIGIQSLRDRMEKCRTVADVLAVLSDIRDELNGVQLNTEETTQQQALAAKADELRKTISGLEQQRSALRQAMNEASAIIRGVGWEQEKRKRRGWKTEPEAEAKISAAQADYDAAAQALKDWEAEHPEIVDKTESTHDKESGSFEMRIKNPLRDEYHDISRQIRAISENAKARNLMENQATRAWITFGSKFFGILHYRRNNGSDAFAGHVVNAMNKRVGGWDWAEKERTKPVKQATKDEVRFQLKVVDSYQRKGGKPVSVQSTQDLKDAYGFRDVQSGNWVLKDPASARFHVEQTAAAMTDMGDILGIDPTVLGLGGRLAMAFGARGSGAKGWKDSAPRAHYEPVQRVINLTKMGGGGSLGHEYFHALDNMLGELVNQKASDKKGDMVTVNPALLPLGKIRSAVSELQRTMLSGTKRMSESFKVTPKDRAMAKANLDRQYLAAFQKSIKDAGSAEAAVNVVRSRYLGTDNKRLLKQRDTWIRIAVAYYAPADKDVMTLATGPYGSDFQMGAIELDGGQPGKYWSTPEEMAARAFQAYLEDKLSAADRRNDYLSALADNKHHVDPLFGIEWKPFPEGEERTRINAAFDNLFAAIREEQVLEKAAANKPLMDSMFPNHDPYAVYGFNCRCMASRESGCLQDVCPRRPPDDAAMLLLNAVELSLEA